MPKIMHKETTDVVTSHLRLLKPPKEIVEELISELEWDKKRTRGIAKEKGILQPEDREVGLEVFKRYINKLSS
jgi:hypothetical protein